MVLSSFPTSSYVTFAFVLYDPDVVTLQHSPNISLSRAENNLVVLLNNNSSFSFLHSVLKKRTFLMHLSYYSCLSIFMGIPIS